MRPSCPSRGESFDAVLCQSAVFFFPDVDRAFAEMARVVRPGGVVAIQTYAALADQPAYQDLDAIVRRIAPGEALDLLDTYWSMGDLSGADVRPCSGQGCGSSRPGPRRAQSGTARSRTWCRPRSRGRHWPSGSARARSTRSSPKSATDPELVRHAGARVGDAHHGAPGRGRTSGVGRRWISAMTDLDVWLARLPSVQDQPAAAGRTSPGRCGGRTELTAQSADGCSISAYVEGSGSVTVIIAGGRLDDGRGYAGLAAELSGANRVLRLTRRQYRTDLARWRPVDIADEAADVVALSRTVGRPCY